MEHLDVLIVGAGLSGIGAAHHLQTECPWASYAIFEARDAIGGTWDLFRYPGIRSDSDMYTLGYSVPARGPASSAIADGGSILQYIEDTAAEDGHRRPIRFHHRIVARRLVHRRRPLARHRRAHRHRRARSSSRAGFVFSCTGYYRYDHGYLPDFAGHGPLRRHASCTRRRGPTTSTSPGSGSW